MRAGGMNCNPSPVFLSAGDPIHSSVAPAHTAVNVGGMLFPVLCCFKQYCSEYLIVIAHNTKVKSTKLLKVEPERSKNTGI